MAFEFYRNFYFRFAFLFCLFILTACIAASVFQALEDDERLDENNIIANFSRSYNISTEKVKEFVNLLKTLEDGPKGFAESFVLTMSLFFTIGWSHSLPTNVWSQVFAVVMSLVGIPLTMLMVVTLGRIITAHVFDLIIVSMRHTNDDRYDVMRSQKSARKRLTPVLLALTITHLLLMAAIVAYLSDIEYDHALYYSAMSLMTLGLGDFQQKLKSSSSAEIFGHCVFLVIWLVTGVSLLLATVLSVTSYNKKKLTNFDRFTSNESTPLKKAANVSDERKCFINGSYEKLDDEQL